MRIDPQIAALRGDRAPQRKAQRVLEAIRDRWIAGTAAPVMRDLEAYGAGTSLEDCAALGDVLANLASARAMVDALFEPMTEALAAHPLGQVPMRHQYSNGLAMIQLGRSGRAALTLLTYDTLEQENASACFAGGDRFEIVLEGVADIRDLELAQEFAGRAAIDQRIRRIAPGDRIRCTRFAETRAVDRVHGRLVLLRLARTEEVPEDTRQYSLVDGRLIHRASGSREESQREMAMALLGRMGRRDAAPLLAELSQEGSPHIRWQSLRECLALDSGTGFAALARLAADPGDELAPQAGALRAQLLEAYPRLARLEIERCPA